MAYSGSSAEAALARERKVPALVAQGPPIARWHIIEDTIDACKAMAMQYNKKFNWPEFFMELANKATAEMIDWEKNRQKPYVIGAKENYIPGGPHNPIDLTGEPTQPAEWDEEIDVSGDEL